MGGRGKRREKKSLLLASRRTGQGKKLEFLAKRGWQIVGEIGPSSTALGDLESNQDYLIQSQVCYHCTIPQYEIANKIILAATNYTAHYTQKH